MLTPDQLDFGNGCFEAVGSMMKVMDVRRLLIDRRVEGVSFLSSGFFASWSVWNLLYYTGMNQMFSLIAGAALGIGSVTWVVMALYFSRKKLGTHI